MRTTNVAELQQYLENLYDIPFQVRETWEKGENVFRISPANEMDSLFEIKILFRQKIRVVIEIIPQKFAADMIRDMYRSSTEKRMLFLATLGIITSHGCKVDIRINDNRVQSFDETLWTEEWSTFFMRFTKSPIVKDDNEFDELKLAKEWADLMICLMLSLLNVEQLEDDLVGVHEGGKKKIVVNKYDRNPVNRKICLEKNGYTCKICGFDFEKKYGAIGHEFIHVHHIVPVSEMGDGYRISPENDLIPVCPNCHAMLHATTPPLLPEELITIIRRVKGEYCG